MTKKVTLKFKKKKTRNFKGSKYIAKKLNACTYTLFFIRTPSIRNEGSNQVSNTKHEGSNLVKILNICPLMKNASLFYRV